jgi:response regulator RpfG family c-di-GMP phosphodiesterase
MEQSTVVILLEIALLGIIYNCAHYYYERRRAKKMAIIEDSDVDFLMMKNCMKLRNTNIVRYKSADMLEVKFAISRPDAVVIDYRLEGKETGDHLLRVCQGMNIPAVLVTADDGPIGQLDEKRIIRKKGGAEWCNILQSWAKNKLV